MTVKKVFTCKQNYSISKEPKILQIHKINYRKFVKTRPWQNIF
jgi:hypothetical protein